MLGFREGGDAVCRLYAQKPTEETNMYDEDELEAASQQCEALFAREFEACMGELGAMRFDE